MNKDFEILNKITISDEKYGALYIRVSSGEQTEYSPDSQLKLGKKFAKEHNINILTEHIYIENGVSGRNASKRSEFQRMISIAKQKPKPFDVILVYDFSRFARNKEEAVMYKALLRKKLGIEVISITQPLSNGKESVILESMYEAMDEYYSLNLSENVHRGRMEKAERGEWNGKAPFGYDYDKKNKTLKINKEEAEIVKLVHNRFDKNNNIRQITIELQSLNIKTKEGSTWNDHATKRLLNNIVYIGKVTNGQNIIFNGKHKSIIDNTLWKRNQKKMNEREKMNIKYKRKEVKYDSWLRGIVKCSKCGHSLIVCESKKSKPYFQCGFYSKSECKESHYIQVEKLENAILEKIKNTYTNKIDINISTQYNNTASELLLIENKINNLKNKEKRIKLAYQDGIDTLEEYKENKKELLKEKEELELLHKKYNIDQKKNEHRNEVYKKTEQLYETLMNDECNMQIKQNLANLLFDKIVFNKQLNAVEITYK